MLNEIKKMVDAKIIKTIIFFSWISNLVLVKKKNGEITLCMDFRNLNKSFLKDNYPLLNMEYLLQVMVGSSVFSLLDGFSWFN